MPILSAVEKYIREKDLFREGDRILCALSGGGDSVALLHILSTLSGKLGFSVCAAHFNHCIRGAEADRDEDFSEQLCNRYGIPFLSGRGNVPMVAESSGEGLEECARRLRYDFLFDAMKKLGCNKLSTAHHSTDNAETVIFHLIRGSGINGLGGISPIREDGVIRPLLCVSREEIEEYLKNNGLDFVTDSTNSDTVMTRNFIRAKMLPLIKTVNPSAERAITRLSEAAREDEEYLSDLADRVSDDAPLSELAELPIPILKRYIKRRFEQFAGKDAQLEYERIMEICRAIKSDGDGFRISLPRSAQAVSERGRLIFTPSETNWEAYSIHIDCAGEYKTPNGNILVTEDKEKLDARAEAHPNTMRTVYGYEHPLDITVRSRLPGDKYLRGGMHRAVRKELNAIGYPASKRDALPIFCDEDGIFWVPGLRPRDGISKRSNEKSKQLIYIGYTEN